MKTALLLVLLILGTGGGEGAPVEPPWEPTPVRTRIAPEEVEPTGESGVVGSVVELSLSIYRFLLSDQQGDVCVFSPSCSHYAEQAIDSCGPLLGVLMFADRLQRCNWTAWNYATRYYPVVNENGRMALKDPVRADSERRELLE